MPSVTVDIEDLERLVWATAAIKQIEAALAQRSRDPFVRPHLDFAAAHDRCAAAMRNARRAEAGTAIAWDGALEQDEAVYLGTLKVKGSEGLVHLISGSERLQHPEVDRLSAKGCVVIGQCAAGVHWAGQDTIEWRASPEFAVKVTPRGRDKFKEYEAARVASVVDVSALLD